MTRYAMAALLAVFPRLLIGCGQSSNSPVGDRSPSAAEAVARFYEALRAGDNEAIEALLTDRAREEAARHGLGIQSHTSESLQYEIVRTDYVTEARDGAHVVSLWTDADATGRAETAEVIWVLRRQPDGWRIAGMATPAAERQPPLPFDVENPRQMPRTQQYAQAPGLGTPDAGL